MFNSAIYETNTQAHSRDGRSALRVSVRVLVMKHNVRGRILLRVIRRGVNGLPIAKECTISKINILKAYRFAETNNLRPQARSAPTIVGIIVRPTR